MRVKAAWYEDALLLERGEAQGLRCRRRAACFGVQGSVRPRTIEIAKAGLYQADAGRHRPMRS